MRLLNSVLLFSALITGVSLRAESAARREAVRFNTAFEGAALGDVEVLGETEFRVHVPGQQDERGRNRQATWYYFRLELERGRRQWRRNLDS